MAKKKNLGIYHSGLEVYCAEVLKDNRIKFEYERKYTIVEGFNYPSTYYKSVPKNSKLVDKSNSKQLPITYKPDFVLTDHNIIIETKGFVRRNDSFPLRWKIFMKFLVDNGMSHYRLFIPKNKSQVDEIIELIKNDYPKTK